MKNAPLLIIEDNKQEAKIAKEIAKSIGLETIVFTTFKEALEGIERSNTPAIASDLFFPSGEINQEPYIRQVLPIYEAHLKTFKPITEGPLVLAIKQVFGEIKNKTKEELWNEFVRPIFLKNWKEEHIESVKDAYFGIQFHSKYEKLQKQIKEVEKERNIPYGIFVTQEARRLRIPCYIVTSTNHHDIAFEPIRNRIGRYTDRLDETGHKDWKTAFEELLKELGGQK